MTAPPPTLRVEIGTGPAPTGGNTNAQVALWALGFLPQNIGNGVVGREPPAVF
jgi:hypothetical protein